MKQKVTIEIICVLLILLFVYAASSKLIEYSSFKIQLGNSPFLNPFAAILAWLIPSVELITVLMLTVNCTRKYGLYASLMLLLIFTLYIEDMILFGVHLPCSCGCAIQQLSWKQHIAFNIFFIVLGIIGIYFHRHTIIEVKQRTDIL